MGMPWPRGEAERFLFDFVNKKAKFFSSFIGCACPQGAGLPAFMVRQDD
jgi:hypothetical protein